MAVATAEASAYPKDQETHANLLSRLRDMHTSAKTARLQYEERWTRYYKQYRSYMQREAGDWRSRVFIPMVFWTVETITPKLVQQLPKTLVLPVAEEDVQPATTMEATIDWCAKRANLFLEQVKATKSALKYGTGLLKTFYDVREANRPVQVPKMRQVTEQVPVMDPETEQQLTDPDGEPVFEERVIGEEPETDEAGQPVMEEHQERYVVYDGPAAEWIDNRNFWPAPDATCIEDSRYGIHRVVRTREYVQRLIKDGIFQLPEGMEPDEAFYFENDPVAERLDEVGLGPGPLAELNSRRCVLDEFWVEEQVITVLNERAIVRVAPYPFTHGEKPFVRIVDHLVEGEFWGIGEVEPLEGLQDLHNALVNQRIDNVRLTLDAMFMYDEKAIEDPRDLVVRTGGTIRVKTQGLPLNQSVQRVDFGDVSGSAFAEAAETERMAEKTSGVSNYQTGTESPEGRGAAGDTATGAALITEQGNTRFAHKTVIAELTGWTPLARHFGAIIQQFWTTERMLRIQGPKGAWAFQRFTPEGVQGAFDYEIEASSSSQTESLRKQQSMGLMDALWDRLGPQGQQALTEDLLRDFGRKDIVRYMGDFQMGMLARMGVIPPAGMLGAPAAPGVPAPPGVANPEDFVSQLPPPGPNGGSAGGPPQGG